MVALKLLISYETSIEIMVLTKLERGSLKAPALDDADDDGWMTGSHTW